MLALTDFTTYDEVRAALGVSDEELEDATLGLDLYALGLDAELGEIGDTLAADFVVQTDPAATPTAQKFVDAVKLFSPYAVAKQLLPALPLLAPKTITDGKASITRDSSAPFKVTMERVNADYERYRKILEARYAAFKGTGEALVSLRPFLSVVSPASDPVTGS